MEQTNNPPAFPGSEHVQITEMIGGVKTTHWVPSIGMTLRDYFAIKSLPIAADKYFLNDRRDNEYEKPYLARKSYEMADAMLAERLK